MPSSRRRSTALPLLLSAFALALAAVPAAHAQTPQPHDVASALQERFAQIAQKVEPAVVTITATRTIRRALGRAGAGQDAPGDEAGPRGRLWRTQGTGSGVILSPDGWVVTNEHVVGRASTVSVKLQDGRVFSGQVRSDYRSDIALVKVEGADLPHASLGDSDRVKVGHWAIAIGSPFRYEGTFSVGVISAISRSQWIGGRGEGERLYPSLLQTDAAINPGNSGGPLVNLDGEIIGINTAIETDSGGNVGIAFAVPSNTVRYVTDMLRKEGRVRYGYLGIEPETVTPRLANLYGAPSGALVMSEPTPDSPAARAGILIEDVITGIDGRTIRNESDLRTTVSRILPGTTVRIALVRNGAARTVEATLTEAPRVGPEPPAAPADAPSLGIAVAPVTPDTLGRAGLPESAKGVVIKSLDDSSGESLLRVGDVILQVNGRAVTTPEEFEKATANLKSGDAVRILWQGRRGGLIVKRVQIVAVE